MRRLQKTEHGALRVRPILIGVSSVVMATAVAGCEPKVKVEAPDKPITINLNVRIEQEVRIKVEKEAERLLEEKKELF